MSFLFGNSVKADRPPSAKTEVQKQQRSLDRRPILIDSMAT